MLKQLACKAKQIFNNLKMLSTYKQFYDLHHPPAMDPRKPSIFNEYGEPLHLFFIKDRHCAHVPYMGFSRYIFWDRNNFGLDTHFYSHEQILCPEGKPIKRYALFFEAESIVPNDYLLFESHLGIHQDFDAIFTHSDRLLDKYPNAQFAPPKFALVWHCVRRRGN